MKQTNWNLQLCRIQDKGFQAFLDGIPSSENPYTQGYSNQNGPGGQLQRQRRQSWDRGWELAKKEQETSNCNVCGRKTKTEDEFLMGMCDMCSFELRDQGKD